MAEKNFKEEEKNYSIKNHTLADKIETAIAVGLTVVSIAGLGYFAFSWCKPKVDLNSVHRLEQLSDGVAVRATNDISGRRVLAYNPQDNPDSNRYIGICALDRNRDGTFEEIYNGAGKGSNLEQYVNLDKLENLYSHAVQFGTDILPDGEK